MTPRSRYKRAFSRIVRHRKIVFVWIAFEYVGDVAHTGCQGKSTALR